MDMSEDKKKMLSIIIGSGPPTEEGGDKESILEAKKAAFKDFAEAVKSGDEAKGVEAFASLYDLCGYLKEEEAAEDSGESAVESY